jgi:oligopeptide/dipeptide ABC transporter ATP-binding protein
MISPLLDVRDLTVSFVTEAGTATAVDHISFMVREGETLAVVGESGSGKSVMSLALLRLIPEPPGRITADNILFEGEDLLSKSPEEIRRIRGGRIAMIFQEPNTSLNPVHRIGDQIAEAVLLHERVSRTEAHARAVEMLRLTGIPSPEERVRSYPHELSGGMRQRAMIAMALACRPKLLIADEPTTALDVTVQAQILDLMRDLKAKTGAAIILITHDLGVVAEMADRVAVMYAGRIVETAPVTDLFAGPEHPYTLGLLSSMPSLSGKAERLAPITGSLPNPLQLPTGCRFAPRCPFSEPRCEEADPPLREVRPGHFSACRRTPLLEQLA